MASKNTSRRNSRNMKVRRFLKEVNTYASTIVTVVAIIAVLVAFFGASGKIFSTQVKLIHYRAVISENETTRDYYNREALHTAGSDYGIMARATADAADEKVSEYSAKRSALHKSDDKLVAWAARNDVDFLTILVGLSFLAAALITAFISLLFFYPLRDAFRFFFAVIFNLGFKALALVLYIFVYAFVGISEFFGSVEKDQRNAWEHVREVKKATRRGKVIDITKTVSKSESWLSRFWQRHIG